MSLTKQIAKQFTDVYFGGNWTAVNLKDTVLELTWQDATTKVYTFNTIVALVYHMNYYVGLVLKVMKGLPLDGHDKFSFNHPAVESQQQWDSLLEKVWADANEFSKLVEELPEEKLWQNLAAEKYGNYYRNITGIIEHNHYHLGQIILIKKLVRQKHEIGDTKED